MALGSRISQGCKQIALVALRKVLFFKCFFLTVAGVATNGGHNSSAFDGSWGGPHNDVSGSYPSFFYSYLACLCLPPKNTLIDFGWRAVHLSVLAGKDIIKQFYSETPKGSYYLSCSTGKLAVFTS